MTRYSGCVIMTTIYICRRRMCTIIEKRRFVRQFGGYVGIYRRKMIFPILSLFSSHSPFPCADLRDAIESTNEFWSDYASSIYIQVRSLPYCSTMIEFLIYAIHCCGILVSFKCHIISPSSSSLSSTCVSTSPAYNLFGI